MNSKHSEAVEVAKELINISSASIKNGELGVANYIKDYLKSLKIDSEVIKFSNGRANVVAQIGKGEGLMFNGHMDTVPIGNLSLWKNGPEAVVKGNKLYGLGSSDMKGGIASILASFKGIDLSKSRRRILLAFVADEEVNSEGSKILLEKRRSLFKGVKYGVIAEPTDLKIQIAQKGAIHLNLDIFGKAAHGSRPWEGDSAIFRAARFISAFEKLSSNFPKKDKLMGQGTLNIGLISGGSAVNVIPDMCQLSIDRRIVSGETVQSAISQVHKILKAQNAKYNLTVKFARAPYKVSKNSFPVKLLKSISKKPLTWTTGYTEAEMYKTMANIDSVVFGPGKMSTIHKPDEYVEISNLNLATAVFRQVINKWI